MIGFVGMSHLGLNYSLATAGKGFDVVCYDPNATLVGALNAGIFPIEEPGFKELHASSNHRISYTCDPSRLGECELVFYALDVPTNELNESDPEKLVSLISSTSPALRSGTAAVVMSQVQPGFMRSLDATTAEGVTWHYQVETLIFGAAVLRALEPERIIVGAMNPIEELPRAYKRWLDAFACPVLVMLYESAELAKIAINLFLVSSVSTTNMLGEICEAIGADWSEIAPALRLDKRIGHFAYLKPGLGISGGNLERDLVTIQALAKKNGSECGIVAAWSSNSSHAKGWASRTLSRELSAFKGRARIALWGLAYKQDTHSLKNSPAIELVRALPSFDFHAYDPAATIERGMFRNLVAYRDSASVLEMANALIIMTPWPEFGLFGPEKIASLLKGDLVVDPYGILGHSACISAGLRHLRIGVR